MGPVQIHFPVRPAHLAASPSTADWAATVASTGFISAVETVKLTVNGTYPPPRGCNERQPSPFSEWFLWISDPETLRTLLFVEEFTIHLRKAGFLDGIVSLIMKILVSICIAVLTAKAALAQQVSQQSEEQISLAHAMQKAILVDEDIQTVKQILKKGFEISQPIGCGSYTALHGALQKHLGVSSFSSIITKTQAPRRSIQRRVTLQFKIGLPSAPWMS